MLSVRNLNYIYSPGTVFAKQALRDISFDVQKGEFIGIMGRTGSGKSTLIQHLNGLVKATSGDIIFEGKSIYEKGYNLKSLRQQVGLVFQYPEYQLFESTIIDDVKFGPKNMGLLDEEATERAKEALLRVGVVPEKFCKSPFEISGGNKRRVAIAGVLAMRPKILILDEPTAGLDPRGRDEILGYLKKLHDETETTVILVSHSMEDMADYADRLLVIDDGKIAMDDTPKNVFKNLGELEHMGLSAPQVSYIIKGLRERGYDLPEDITTVEEAAAALRCFVK